MRPTRSTSTRSSSGSSTSDRGPRPARRRSSPSSRPGRPAPPRAAVSELEAALTASVEQSAPLATTFEALGLPAALVRALAAGGISSPFPIQARTVPDAVAGRDVLGRGQTGSGKTLAFGLPLLSRLAGGGRTSPGSPRGLVLVPTRELAEQVQRTLTPLVPAVGLRTASVYGGASMSRQISALRRGVDVVVATPGRLLDLIQQGECSLGSVEVTVLDEADHMADLGFLPAVTQLLDMTPAGGQRMLFSATLDRGVDRLVRAYLTDPAVHAVASATAPVEAMDHRAVVVRGDDKVATIAEVGGRPGRTLMFVRTKHGADRLAKQLARTGLDASPIHGGLNQNARQRALDGFAAGRVRVLVATDVAARGLHIDDVDLVVHVDPPQDHKDYLHRSGRTARAGASGSVLSLLQPEQVGEARKLFTAAGVSVEPLTGDAAVETVRELATSGTRVVPVPLATPSAPVRRAPSPGRPPRSRLPGTAGKAATPVGSAPRSGIPAARAAAGAEQPRRPGRRRASRPATAA